MYQALLIFIGGGIGSILRFFIAKNSSLLFPNNFPIGILIINILASFILGIFIGQEINQKLSFSFRAFIAIGFCGGFSTFSTFSADTLFLIQNSRYFEACLNIVLNVVLCVLATSLGIYLSK